EDRAAAADLHRPPGTAVRAAREAPMTRLVVALVLGVPLLTGGRFAQPPHVRAKHGSVHHQSDVRATFDSNRAWERLRQLVAIGPRPAGSPALEQARKYIKGQLASAGLTVVEQAWDDETPLGKVHLVNLIATLPGEKKDRIVIAGHYDTKLFRDIRFVGASDGGSSAAVLI